MSTKIAVPNSGYINKVYFNTDLSIEEVKAILNDAFIEPGVMDIMESLLWSDSVSIDVSSYGADFSITLWSSSSDEVIAIFDSGDNSFYGIKGWNPDITYPLVINSNVYDDDSGLKNDKLLELFYTYPSELVKEEEPLTLNSFLTGIADAIRSKKGTTDKINASNFASEIESIESGSGGGSVTVTIPGEWQGTAVPNSGYVDKVYVNNSLSMEEVNKLLSQIDYSSTDGSYYNAVTDGNNSYLYTHSGSNSILYYSSETGNETTLYASYEYDDGNGYFIGWNPNASMQLEIGKELTNYVWGYAAGHQNDILSSLFSITPFVKGEGEVTILTGDYDGSKVTINNIEPGWQGTAVPNTGYVDKVYFNTNLSVEDMTNFINKEFDPENNGGNTIYLLYNENSETNDYIEIYMNYSYWNRLYFDITIYTSNGFNGYVFSLDDRYDDISGTNFIGWNPSLSNPLPINLEVMSQCYNGSVGTKNHIISSLFSLTPFEYKDEEEASTINLKEYIKEQKLPLQLKIDLPEPSNPLVELINSKQSCAYLFADFGGYNIPNLLAYDDTKDVYYFNYMYKDCYNASSFPELNTSNGNNFTGMYEGCSNATSFPELNTSNGYDFSYMYYNCTSATSFPLIDTSNGRNFSYMYYDTNATEYPELNTSSGNDFSYMYYSCSNATSFPELNTSSGNDFNHMYEGCSSATSFPALDTSEGYDFSYMYENCSSATEFPELNIQYGDNFHYMYNQCYNAMTFPTLNTQNGTDFSGMYRYCSKATSVPQLNTSNGIDFSEMYNSCSSVTEFPALDTSNGTNFYNMYSSCSSATSFPLIDTSNGTNFSGMFQVCSSATSFPLINTSNGTNFSYMYSYSTIETPLIDTSNGTNFSGMFFNCKKVTSFPLINTSNGTNFYNMYYGCSSATSFPLINTSNGTDFNSMFQGCSSAKKIDISKLTSSRTSNTYHMFYGCSSLKAVIIRSFGLSYALDSEAFKNCYSITGNNKDGYIYVPRDMIETLSSATNWSNYASQFRALEDYTVDGTTTGEFDDEKAGLV